jgi:hypothetical protein
MNKRNATVLATRSSLAAMATGKVTKSPAETTMTIQTEFYCNVNGLSSAERARHSNLARKLSERRQKIVETEKGYEFQYRPSDISLAEIAEWTMLESKCCPFFDFHLDLENEGKLLCLRLTGREGVKKFIQSEFNVLPGVAGR